MSAAPAGTGPERRRHDDSHSYRKSGQIPLGEEPAAPQSPEPWRDPRRRCAGAGGREEPERVEDAQPPRLRNRRGRDAGTGELAECEEPREPRPSAESRFRHRDSDPDRIASPDKFDGTVPGDERGAPGRRSHAGELAWTF